jgi:hypothetical protein
LGNIYFPGLAFSKPDLDHFVGFLGEKGGPVVVEAETVLVDVLMWL